MSKQNQIPKSVQVYLESASSALIDADSLPGALQHNASRYFLLLTAWELAQIADEKSSAWAFRAKVNPQLLRNHGYKLRESPAPTYIKIDNGKVIETKHVSEDQKNELRKLLIYGRDDISRRDLFMRGWYFDTFRNRLIGKIKLLKVMIKAMQELDIK